MQVKKHHSDCLVARGVDIFGDRWTLLIIRDMLLHGKKTFSDFRDSGEGIATNILTDRLKYLEAEGIVTKSRDPLDGKRNIYGLTEKGFALAPVLFEIVRWSGAYFPVSLARENLLKRIKTDPGALLSELRETAKP